MTAAVHGLCLLPLLRLTGPPPPPDASPIRLDLLHPEPPKTVETVRVQAGPAARPTEAAAPQNAVAAPSSPPDALPAPRISATPGTRAPGGQTAQGQGSGAGSGGLIGLGCLGDLRKMKPDQRQACEAKKWAGLGKRDPSDSGRVPDAIIDPAKAEYYQAVLDARHSPGHGPGLGCVLKFGGGQKPHWQKPPHSLKLGPLPCYVTPPEGALTPDVDVPPIDEFVGKEKAEDRSPAFDGRPRL